MADFLKRVGFQADIVAAINPTNPLLTPGTIDNFFHDFSRSSATTAFSVTGLSKHVLAEGVPVNYSPFGPHPRTQDVRKLHFINWAISAWKVSAAREKISQRGDSLYVGEVAFVEIPAIEAFDIDTQEDFFVAQALASAINLADDSISKT